MRLDPDGYFVNDFASHTSQGDIYTDVPFVWRTRIRSADQEPSGKRRRPADPGEVDGDLRARGGRARDNLAEVLALYFEDQEADVGEASVIVPIDIAV